MNFKHLRYFLYVADAGSIAGASTQLHVSPQTISEQLQQLEEQLGGSLFAKQGRKLGLTDKGKMVLSYAREIFSLGAELEANAKTRTTQSRRIEFRVGVADAVPKSIAYQLLAPVLEMGEHVRLTCREWRLDRLLSQLALHELDLVIADVPLPRSVSVKAYSHPLRQTGVSLFAHPTLRDSLNLDAGFPQCLDGAPLLMPGEDSPTGHQLRAWFELNQVRPRIVGEFDDDAMAHEFGRHGVGFFASPTALREQLESRLGVAWLGEADGVTEQYYAISVERRIKHPCVMALTQSAEGHARATRLKALGAPPGKKKATPTPNA